MSKSTICSTELVGFAIDIPVLALDPTSPIPGAVQNSAQNIRAVLPQTSFTFCSKLSAIAMLIQISVSCS